MQRNEAQHRVTMHRQATRTIFIGWLGLLGLLGLIELHVPSPSHAQPGRFGDGPGPHGFSPGPPNQQDRRGPPDHAEYARPRGRRGPGGPGGPPPGRFIERQAERLGLDEETRSSIRTIADTSHAKGKEIRKSLRLAHREMRQLLQQDIPNEASVLQQAAKIGTLQGEEQQNRLQAMLQIRALLTPEQRQEIIQLRKENRPHRRRRGRGRRRGRPFRACQENIAQICPDVEPGRSAIQCLTDNWDTLSEECHAFFERGSERGSRRRGGD
jgi:protein CpxP